MRSRRIPSLRLLLSLMLLVVQLGATAHAYTHVSSRNDASGAPVDTVQLCGQCQSGQPLFAAMSGSDCTFTFDPAEIGPAAHCRSLSLIEARAPLAFRSRAPPVLL